MKLSSVWTADRGSRSRALCVERDVCGLRQRADSRCDNDSSASRSHYSDMHRYSIVTI